MPKQKSYETQGDKSKKKLVISSDKLRQLEKGVEREMRIEQGYDPAFQGDGVHGGSEEAQKRRVRKKAKTDLNKYRNVPASDIED